MSFIQNYDSIIVNFKLIKIIDFSTALYKKDGYLSLLPWDHCSKCYMDRKRIQCLSNASQHVPCLLYTSPSPRD